MTPKTGTLSTHYSGVIQLQRISNGKVVLARTFRKNMTSAETLLWSQLRRKKCGGMKFRRQQIIEGFIADFFCAEKNLVIEVDGPIHDRESQKKNDQHRHEVFKLRGIREMRFKNREVVKNVEDVIKRIKVDNLGS
jgi:very-short-patch-repair endonuclease